MIVRRTIGTFVTAALALCATASAALAQITTGTVTGTVMDTQGAVVPGATVTLVSATQGNRSQAQTNTDGDFVFPNVSAGTYLLRVTMDGFKTLERPGVVVSPGERTLSNLTIEVGALAETITVRAEVSVVPAPSRRTIFRRHHRRGREPADLQPQLHGAGGAGARGDHRREQHAAADRRRRRSQHHDGRCLDDGYRQQPAAAADEHRVDR